MSATDQKVLQADLAIDVPAPPCLFPYFIVACWHGRWSIRPGEWGPPENNDRLNQEVERLQQSGWSYVKICKLPL